MREWLWPWLFIALAGPACLFLALWVPARQVPDEPAHAVRAESLLHGEAWGHRERTFDGTISAGVTANAALLSVAQGHESATWQPAPIFVPAPNVAVYFPVLYAPTALALGTARAAGLSPWASFLAARLLNAAGFVAIGGLALVLARAGRTVIFVTLMLPMTLWLAASLSPDGLLIAISAVGGACLTRMAAGRRWAFVVAGSCLALMGATKPCYLPLALAIWAPVELRGLAWRRVIWVAAIVGPGLIWSAASAVGVAVPFARPPYLPGPLWPGDPARVFRSTDVGAQILVLIERPWRLVTLPLRSFASQGRNLVQAAIGVLGNLDLVLPKALYGGWLLAIGSAGLADLLGGGRRDAVVRPLGAACIMLGVVLSAQAIFLLEYLSWTLVGTDAVDGVQGRYFVPLLPFAGVALSAMGIGDRPLPRRIIAAVPIAVAATSVVLVGRVVVDRYGIR